MKLERITTILSIIGMLAVGALWIFDRGAMKLITFDSPEQKVEHTTHVKHSPDPVQFKIEHHEDSMFRKEVREFIKQTATDLKDQKRHIHNMDSIQLLNADQMYQIKEQLKTIDK